MDYSITSAIEKMHTFAKQCEQNGDNDRALFYDQIANWLVKQKIDMDSGGTTCIITREAEEKKILGETINLARFKNYRPQFRGL